MPTSCNAGTKRLPQRRGGSRSNAAPLRAGTLRVLCHATYTSRVFAHMRDRAAVRTRVESSQCPLCHVHAGRQAPHHPLHVGAAHTFCYAIAKARQLLHATRVPVPSSTNIAALLPTCYVHEKIQTQTEQLTLTRRTPLIFEFYFGRLLTESKRIAATYRRDQEACEDEVLPCQPLTASPYFVCATEVR